ncbi:extracellular solute-binding protein [Leifsonia poae]|uniref:extracellular solute-binding protein n=1 Tax=Leifsonia poae TaxID=110933 RepID=UPI001CBAC979|nr:extracellular solute-binding protein [Leifsonia poae]
MKTKRVLAGVIAAAATLALVACSGPSTPADGKKTLTVWYMTGGLSSGTTDDITARFEKETGAKVKVEVQQWANINTKLSTALSQSNPPDLVEIGNTDAPLFTANGALADVSGDKASLTRGQNWLPGLAGPATFDGKLYAAPLYAGNRAVAYNKALWSAAGVTDAPTTYDELIAGLDKVKAANNAPDFSAFYFPGKYWYGALQFVWDAGGGLASTSGGKSTAELSSPASQKGLEQWKAFQNAYSTVASRSVSTDAPDQDSIFASGKAATILTTTAHLAIIRKANPSIEIGTFPLPSQNKPGANQPVFLGGSVMGIAAKSPNRDLALRYLKTVTSDTVQLKNMVGRDGWEPISTQLVDKAIGSATPEQKTFFEAGKRSVPTPAVPGWATIESDASIGDFFGAIASGNKSVKDAASAMDAHLNDALNATK